MWKRKVSFVILCFASIFLQGCSAFRNHNAEIADSTLPPGTTELSGARYKVKEALRKTGKVILDGVDSIGWQDLIPSFRDEEDDFGFDPDPLWRAGYGFNNPNGDRSRAGQPLLNFDGRVAD